MEVGTLIGRWWALRQAFDRTTAREVDRLVGEGRQADAWAMLPRLAFPAALDVAVRLAGSDWTPPDGGVRLLDRALPAARLGPDALGPSLSGTPRPLPPVPGPGSVSALSFAPDAPLLAVGRHAQGLEIWTTGAPSLVTRQPAPDPGTDPPAPATTSGVWNTFFVRHVLSLPRRRVLAAVGPAGGPYRDLLLAEAGGWRRLARLPDDVVALFRLPDGACAAVTARGGTLVHADDGSSYRGAPLDLPDDAIPVWGATCSADGRLVATWSHTTATLVDRRSGGLLAAAAPLEPLAGGDATVTVRPSPALPDLRFDLTAGRIAHLDFLPDGDGLVAGTIDGATRLLDLDFTTRGTLTSHQRFPVVLAAPSGRIVASTKDGVTRLHPWPTGAADGTAVELRPAPGDPRGRIAMSPRGWLLAVAQDGGDAPVDAITDAGTVCRWDLTPMVLAPLVRKPLGEGTDDDVAAVREAIDAARIYDADEPTHLALDALLALVEHARA